jgi:hypothetical protein
VHYHGLGAVAIRKDLGLYIPYDDGSKQVFIFNFEGNVSGGCNSTARFAIDSTSLKFKGTTAALMVAYQSQTDVTVLYSQTCGAWGNAWDVRAVCVGKIPC